VDLNRDPSGAELLRGADNTELCPDAHVCRRDDLRSRHGAGAGGSHATPGLEFPPYHQTLATEIARVKKLHGYAILLDGHSIRGEVPRFFAGRLPDLNLGTASGESCAHEVQAVAVSVLKSAPGFSYVVNGRFKGGWITRHYGRPYDHVHALQLEIAQRCYMDEAPPYAWDATRAAALVEVLRRLVAALEQWRPAT
jgi:N-formylglutamate amidohydrolase